MAVDRRTGTGFQFCWSQAIYFFIVINYAWNLIICPFDDFYIELRDIFPLIVIPLVAIQPATDSFRFPK